MRLQQISLPDTQAVAQAASAVTALKDHLTADPTSPPRLRLRTEDGEIQVVVPDVVFALLVAMLEELALGHTVAMAPVEQELTTQQAADLLNVSRPYLVGLLEEGKIPFHRVGNRRKVSLADLLAFKQRETTRREQILDELTAEAQDMGLYD